MAVSPLEEAVEAAPSEPASSAPSLLSSQPRGLSEYTSNAKGLLPAELFHALDDDHPEHLMNARWMDLDFKPSSDEAEVVLNTLGAEVTAWQREEGILSRARRAEHQLTFMRTLGALCGDLLGNAVVHPKRWGYRSQSDGDFKGTGLSSKQYRELRRAFRCLGYLEKATGFSQKLFKGVPQTGRTDRVRATDQFLEVFDAAGIRTENLREHFEQILPRKPLELRAPSRRISRSEKLKGRLIKYEETAHTRRLEADIRELNEFLDRFPLEGGVHRGFRRRFNEGTAKGYGWNKGGRLYGQDKDGYQHMNSALRAEMRIDGEPVAEIDISASYLTIFYAQNGLSLDQKKDPYTIDRIPVRAVVKAWMTATFGRSKFHKKWPDESIKQCKKKDIDLSDYDIREVEAAVLKHHPVLKTWPSSEITWADLMFIESEAVIGTMLRLMREHRVPCFSVHDSVIVPRSQCELAKTVLTKEYKRHVGVEPRLKTSE